MALKPEEKIRIERVIASFRQRLASVHGKDADWTKRYRSGDENAIDELIVAACAEHKVGYAEFMEAVEGDPQLMDLQKNSITEVMLGSVASNRSGS